MAAGAGIGGGLGITSEIIRGIIFYLQIFFYFLGFLSLSWEPTLVLTSETLSGSFTHADRVFF